MAAAGVRGAHVEPETQQLEALLTAFTSPDNEMRRRAEAAWEDMKMRLPDKVLEKVCAVLGREGGDAQSEGLRAMAAVLLRTLFDIRSDVWFRVQQRTQVGVKATLLDRLTKEPVAHIRRKLTHAIGQLAATSSGTSEWPEVMALTVALCDTAQPSPEMRVVGLDLMNILSEFCPGMVSTNHAGLFQMFGASLEDANMGVRVASLKAACSFVQDALPRSSAAVASSLVPRMMSVLEATVNAGDEAAAGDVLEALNVVAANQPMLLIADGQNLELVGTAMLSLAASPSLEVSTRELSLEVVTALCESAPSVLRQQGAANTVSRIVQLTITMLAQPSQGSEGPEEEEELRAWLSMANGGKEDDDIDDGDVMSKIAASTLNRISVALGGSAVLSTVMAVCSEFLGDGSNWRRRQAGLLALLLTGEGCGEDLATSGLLPGIVLGPVLAGMQDEHPRVRYAAVSCVGQMTQDFSEWDGDGEGSFQGAFHSQLLPILVESLGGRNADMPRVQAAAAGALIGFCNPEKMEAEWLYEVGPASLGAGPEPQPVGLSMLRSLAALVPSSSSVVVREEALSAVGCVANVLGPSFGSFYGTFVPLAMEIIRATGPSQGGPGAGSEGDQGLASSSVPSSQDTDLLRGKAMEAIALMGQAVGIEVFRGDAHQVIRLLLDEQKTVARDPGNPQASYTLQTLARIAGVLGEEFLPYLAEAVSPLLSALSTDAEIRLSNAPDADLAKEELEAAGLTVMSMDLRGAGRQVFGVNTSLMQAKESACKTLYQYTENLGEGFAPHAAEALSVVLPNLGPRNAVAVQVVSAAIVPKLVGLADRGASRAVTDTAGAAAAAAAGGSTSAPQQEAQRMLDASVDAITQVVSRLSGLGLGGASDDGSGDGGGDDKPLERADQERVCVAADSLSSLLEGRCSGSPVSSGSLLCVSDERLASTATVLRDVAVASIRRSRVRFGGGGVGPRETGGVGGMTGAVDAAELQELERGEEELLVSVVDAVGWMIKGRKEAFLPTFEVVMRPLVASLLSTNAALVPPWQRSFGLCMAIDVLEHTGEGGRRSVFPSPLLPALFQGFEGPMTATTTRQACAYGLGVAADFGGAEFDAHSAEALRCLMAVVEKGDEEDDDDDDDDEDDERWQTGAVTDNAVSAAFRVLLARLGPVCAAFGGDNPTAGSAAESVSAIVCSLLEALPITVDVAEGKVCHRRVVDLALSRHELFFGSSARDWNGGEPGAAAAAPGADAPTNPYASAVIPKLVTAIAGMMEYQPSPAEAEAVAATTGGWGYCNAGVPSYERAAKGLPTPSGDDNDEEMWERQLVDRETRQKAQEALVFLKAAFPKCFQEAWVGVEVMGRSLRS